MTLRPSLLPLRLLLLLLLLRGAVCQAEAGSETESPVRTLQVETLVEPPEPCAEPATFGDTLHIHYSGSLVDGRIFDTSLTRDPLVIELGQKQVIPGLEQSLLDMCVGEEEVLGLERLGTGEQKHVPAVRETLAQEIRNLCQGSQRLPKVTRQSVLGPGHGRRPQPTERGPRLSTHALRPEARRPRGSDGLANPVETPDLLKSPIPRKWWKEHKVMQYCHPHFRKTKAQ
uniref:peptidylprolyl isomerase n=1 Tax=Bos indicus x Bos taurus TaxID=30522 RepID=A0A4W2DGE8_BOBOX